jgi:myo-inositol-1(or 4)-monophosphatase
MPLDLVNIQTQVVELAKEVGAYIRAERLRFTNDKIEIKGLNDLVSYVDRKSELQLIDGLSAILPQAGFIVEEGSRIDKQALNWIVDPLDGTTNFIHGLPCYAVSIALVQDETVLIGVVYEVNKDECFYAALNQGSYCNGEPIHVSNNTQLKNSLIATGFPIFNFSRQTAYLNVLDYFMRNTHGLRRMGAATVDLCYVACGRMDAFYEFNLNAWDVAAGALIVCEAGGMISDFSNKTNWLFGKEIIAGNKELHSATQKVISTYFTQS